MKKELVLGFGRLSRLRFMAYLNLWHLLAFAPLTLWALLATPEDSSLLTFTLASVVVFNLVALKMVAQRYRDAGASGFWSLIYLIPPAAPFIYLILATVPGDRDDNRFGKAPPRSPRWLLIPALLPLVLLIWHWITLINLLFSSAPLLMAGMRL